MSNIMKNDSEKDTVVDSNYLSSWTRSILTSLLVLGLWILCKNPIITLVSIILVPWTLNRIIGKCRSTKGRIVATIILIMFLLISILFYRVQEEPEVVDYGKTEVVTPVEVEPEEEVNPEEKEEEPKVEDQKVSKGKTVNKKYKAPLSKTDLAATYSGFGGNPSTINPNGNTNVIGSDFSEIVCPDNSSQDKEIEEKRNKGHEITDHKDGVTSSVDKIPRPEKPKDESTRVDLDKEKEDREEKEVTSSTEEPKIPDPLPDDEQIKKDAEEVTDKDLEDIANSTPETPAEKPNKEPEEITPPSDEQKPEETKPEEQKPDDLKPEDPKTETEDKKDEVKPDDNKKPITDTDSKKDEAVTPPKNDSDSEEQKPPEVVKNPVSVSASNSTVKAGESVQFNISGDVQSIDGLDGLNFVRGESIVVVSTEPEVATVITIVVIGTDGSSATASVTVNV